MMYLTVVQFFIIYYTWIVFMLIIFWHYFTFFVWPHLVFGACFCLNSPTVLFWVFSVLFYMFKCKPNPLSRCGCVMVLCYKLKFWVLMDIYCDIYSNLFIPPPLPTSGSTYTLPLYLRDILISKNEKNDPPPKMDTYFIISIYNFI